MESREAPAQYRTRMNSKIKGYQSDLQKFNRDLVSSSRRRSMPPPTTHLPPCAFAGHDLISVLAIAVVRG